MIPMHLKFENKPQRGAGPELGVHLTASIRTSRWEF